MTHVMAKGANIALPVAAVRAVLRWSATPGAPDVDASALLLGADGRVRSDADFVFYNQPRHPSGLVRHLPKQQTAGGAEIADTVEAELGKLPLDVDRVVLAGSSEGGSFRSVTGLRVLLYDAAGGEGAPALAEFAMPEADDVTALVAGELYRRAGVWKFRAVGQGYASGLIGLATDFGITVEDEAGAGAAAGSAAPAAPAVDPRTALPDPRPTPRPEPGTYTLAPAVPLPAAPPTPAPPTTAPATGGVPANTPPPPTAPPTLPPAPPAPPNTRPGYGYPQPQPQHAQQQGGYGYPHQQPQQPPQQGGYGYPQPAAPNHPYPQPQHAQQQGGYGYPHQQPQQPPQQGGGYGYPQPNTAPPQSQHQPPQQQGQQQGQGQAGAEEFALPPQGPQFQPR
ncbi:TerD family protein [Kitasatospora sp. CM 4170]|uniref:TerD family protein n=1 Tax=Kitasatospora aburaviensis TaxID=67265 RepID=A0ABW1ER56_9ACTN|nr:TerD family protein [Kitasatospora sp. CM 4170]WNM45645.1 TerD family protein [Kitasatospora sp. CM 4170]